MVRPTIVKLGHKLLFHPTYVNRISPTQKLALSVCNNRSVINNFFVFLHPLIIQWTRALFDLYGKQGNINPLMNSSRGLFIQNTIFDFSLHSWNPYWCLPGNAIKRASATSALQCTYLFITQTAKLFLALNIVSTCIEWKALYPILSSTKIIK